MPRLRSTPWAWLTLIVFVLLGVFAPLIASENPLVLKERGASFEFPAFESLWNYWCQQSSDDFGERRVDYRAIAERDGSFSIFPIIAYDPDRIPRVRAKRIDGPSLSNWFGTDEHGRDLLARLIHATGPSLAVGLTAVFIAGMIGLFVGLLTGMARGTVDLLVSRVIEIVTCFPTIYLVLALIAWLPSGRLSVALVMGFTGWPLFARLVRAEVMRRRAAVSYLGAIAIGTSPITRIRRHLLPFALRSISVPAMFALGGAILVEASLSFLGLASESDAPSWGRALRIAYREQAFWMTLFPTLFLFAVLGSLMSLADRYGAADKNSGLPR